VGPGGPVFQTDFPSKFEILLSSCLPTCELTLQYIQQTAAAGAVPVSVEEGINTVHGVHRMLFPTKSNFFSITERHIYVKGIVQRKLTGNEISAIDRHWLSVVVLDIFFNFKGTLSQILLKKFAASKARNIKLFQILESAANHM
jgi:hypothetical protein